MIQLKKLLIIDDEEHIVNVIQTYFEDNGYEVITSYNAIDGEKKLVEKPDIILLDIMMPGMNGIEFCQKVRTQLLCPIVFLSAKTEESSKLLGLASGGDDYVTKPFSIKELYARIEAHLRRENRPRELTSRIFFESLWIDYAAKECGIDDNLFDFTKKEYGIIELLSLNSGQVFSKERLYEKIWGYDAEGDAASAVTEHIKRIRKKFTEYDINNRIETVWGIGYKWKK